MTIEEDEARIRELATLIEAEKDAKKMVILAAGLERLLTLKLERKKTPARPIVEREPRLRIPQVQPVSTLIAHGARVSVSQTRLS